MRRVAKWIAISSMFIAGILFYFGSMSFPDELISRVAIFLWIIATSAGGWIGGYDFAKREPDIERAGKLSEDIFEPHHRPHGWMA